MADGREGGARGATPANVHIVLAGLGGSAVILLIDAVELGELLVVGAETDRGGIVERGREVAREGGTGRLQIFIARRLLFRAQRGCGFNHT